MDYQDERSKGYQADTPEPAVKPAITCAVKIHHLPSASDGLSLLTLIVLIFGTASHSWPNAKSNKQ